MFNLIELDFSSKIIIEFQEIQKVGQSDILKNAQGDFEANYTFLKTKQNLIKKAKNEIRKVLDSKSPQKTIQIIFDII